MHRINTHILISVTSFLCVTISITFWVRKSKTADVIYANTYAFFLSGLALTFS